MSNIQAVAGGRAGYVRAVFSRRSRGHAVPFDLLRVHLRAVALAGMRRRVAAAFAGYLVTDSQPVAGAVFAPSRADCDISCDLLCATGGDFVFLHGRMIQGALDAPDFIAAGAMRADGKAGYQRVVMRCGVLA